MSVTWAAHGLLSILASGLAILKLVSSSLCTSTQLVPNVRFKCEIDQILGVDHQTWKWKVTHLFLGIWLIVSMLLIL